MPENKPSRAIASISAVLAFAGLLSGCATLPEDATIEPVDYRACLVTDGAADRAGLNDSALYSLNEAVVSFGIKKTIIAANPSKFIKVTDKLIKAECHLIAVVGSRFSESLKDVVATNPATNFLFITDGSDRALVAEDLPNLVVYRIDLYEAGLLAGHIASSFTETRSLTVVCNRTATPFLSGVKAGAAQFDLENGTLTLVNSGLMQTPSSDVLLPYNCTKPIVLQPDSPSNNKLVGYGRDLYLEPSLAEVKESIGATIIPGAGPRLLEAIAADLESEFIGGKLGSTTASFGNGGLLISDEHAIALPSGELQKLKDLAMAYETSFK